MYEPLQAAMCSECVVVYLLQGAGAQVPGLWGGAAPQLQTSSLQGLSQRLVHVQGFL